MSVMLVLRVLAQALAWLIAAAWVWKAAEAAWGFSRVIESAEAGVRCGAAGGAAD